MCIRDSLSFRLKMNNLEGLTKEEALKEIASLKEVLNLKKSRKERKATRKLRRKPPPPPSSSEGAGKLTTKENETKPVAREAPGMQQEVDDKLDQDVVASSGSNKVAAIRNPLIGDYGNELLPGECGSATDMLPADVQLLQEKYEISEDSLSLMVRRPTSTDSINMRLVTEKT